MDFFTAVLLIFITALVNVIVSSLVGTYFQRRIENSYNVEMEKFRASLERFNFEYQTKFSRRIPKTLEVLEGIYQKHSDSELALANLADTIFHSEWGGRKSKPDIQQCKEDFTLKVQDVTRYFESNRIFISDESVAEVFSILERARGISSLVNIDAMYGQVDEQAIKLINRVIDFRELELRKLDDVDKDMGLSAYFLDIQSAYAALSQRLEKHYKTVLER